MAGGAKARGCQAENSNEEVFRRGLVRRLQTSDPPLPFQRQRAKCVTHCAPPGDAGAQGLVSAYPVETTAEEVSV